MNKQKFNPMTEILAGDLANIGNYTEAALAGVVKDFLMTSPVVFGLNVRASATPDLSVFVDCGRLYQNGLQGEQDEPSQPLAIAAPPAAGSRIDRICAQYSAIDDLPQTRNAITDVTTRNTTQQVVTTRTHGAVSYLVVSGQAVPDHPAAPAIPSGYVSLAQILVSAGINNVQSSAICDERPTLKSLLSHTHSGGNDGAAIDYNRLNNLPDLTKLLSNLSWRAKRTYNVGDVCCPSAIGSNKLAECVAAGTTAAAEPVWPAFWQTIVDGDVTWRVRDIRAGNGMPVGHVFPVLATTPPPGCLDISSGALVSRATYPDLWNWVQKNAPLVSEADWQAQNAKQTSVGAYSTGDGATTFRLPKIVDFVSGTDAGRVAGIWRTDDFKSHIHAEFTPVPNGTGNAKGPDSNYQCTTAAFVAGVNSTGATGGSETRPKSIAMLWVVKAFDAFTNQGLLDLTQLANDLAKKNSGLPTGSIVPFLAKTPPPGWLDCSGGMTVSRAAYPGLWAWVQQNAPLISEAEWQAQAANQTSVGAYSTGDGSTTFRLPKIVDFVSGTDAGRAAGTWRVDEIKAHSHAYQTVMGTGGSYGGGGNPWIGNGSTSVTGGPETRPKSISMLYCVKAFESVCGQDLVDVTAISNAMAGKVNYSDFTQGFNGNGYAKMPNGLIIQWGWIAAILPGTSTNITYPIPFPNAMLSFSALAGSTSSSNSAYGGYNATGTGNAKTGCTVWNSSSSGTCGGGTYIALGC